MIVGHYFDGEDGAFAWLQHDVYHLALSEIINGCRRHAETACHMLGLPRSRAWPADPYIDHRVLQMAPDLLAAAWRHRMNVAQPDLLIESPTIADWLSWLARDVQEWSSEPSLVLDVRVAVFNQNQPAGQAAETRLSYWLMQRFSGVPWSTRLHRAIGADFDRLA